MEPRGFWDIERADALRRVLMPIFAKVNPGDITIRHHWTRQRFRLHSFRHRGYWFHGKRRERATLEAFARLIPSGATVFEVGAHIGYISVYLAKLVGNSGQVVVFEPSRENLSYLRRNVASRDNVTVVPMGVGDAVGQLTLNVENLTGQNNSFLDTYNTFESNARSSHIDVSIRHELVDVTTIDAWLGTHAQRPSFLKIDVEGFELQVIRGMRDCLKTLRPMLMVEVTQNSEQVFHELDGHGYALVSEAGDRLTSPTQLDFNVFCLHREAHAQQLREFAR